jgi:hypothetical protein
MEIALAGLAAIAVVAAVMGGLALAVAFAPALLAMLGAAVETACDVTCRILGRGWDPGGGRTVRRGKGAGRAASG